MSWQRVSLESGLDAYSAYWDALNDRYYGGHPFLDSRFISGLLKYFGTGTEQLFVHRAAEIDGLVILWERKFGIWQLFAPDQLEAAPILVPRNDLLAGLFAALPLTAMAIEFVKQDPNFCPTGLMDETSARHVLPHTLTMNISLDGDFDSYWNNRPKNLKKNIRRYFNRIEEDGFADLKIITEPHHMVAGVKRFGELECGGWKGKRGTAVDIDNTQGLFYSELLSRLAMTGQAKVLEYRVGAQLIASRLMVDGGTMSVILKTSYNEAFSRFAPGRLLLYALLERAFNDKNHKVIEFYTNATEDQLAWATGKRVVSHVTYFRWASLARCYKTYQRLRSRGAQANA